MFIRKPLRLALIVPLLAASLLSAQDFKAPLLDHAGRIKNYEQHLQMRSSSPYQEYKWKHIGPLSMCGRVTDIAKPLDKPHTFYISTASGGVWKTENEGTTWVPLFEDAPSASTGTVAVDPQNSETLWVGTGESNIFRSTMAGTGVYKSLDGGKTWKYMGLGESQHIARIVIHPK
ncbi:MAG: WD40/YVTN/BNR-like repeat-containing protein, partial [Planctomycetota bacterium]